jgi:hypothetical protein
MDIKQIVDFISKHQLSSRQFLYLWSMFTDPLYERSVRERGKTKRVVTYGTHGEVERLFRTDPLSFGELTDLEEKEFIINLNSGRDHTIDGCVLTLKFVEEFFIAKDEFEELWETYPLTITINGSNIPARMGDYDSLREKYLDIIDKDKDSHLRIIEITREAKERGMISMGLESYIKGRHWLTYYNMINEERGLEKKVL